MPTIMPVSKAQLRWANSPEGEKALGKAKVAQWDCQAKGRKLPEHSKTAAAVEIRRKMGK